MDEKSLRELLERVSRGELAPAEAVESIRGLPFEDIGFARIDHHRALRCGAPEVVFCAGKTPQQVAEISERIVSAGSDLLATRAEPRHFNAVKERCPEARYRETARCITLRTDEVEARGRVLVVTAGTADLPVAEEAAVTAEMLGADARLIGDVGVAGLHRLLAYRKQLQEANALVVVAGMEGALASVVGGLVARPVIAVPTSVGYGANFGGVAPLLTMLNSCAAGVAVVNIDNGFGAGYMAALINAMALATRAEDE
ncbi:MAG: nickel pincer cofactor biosynthesis protein LarB [Planctomycetes bacterium]|nr:nickel pincer cofactor biosynthesis protein LarB [Planctomycetota bacterium]